MSVSGPLRTELSRYRKRKQLYLDGSVAGAEPEVYRPSIHPAVPRGFARSSQFHQDLPQATTYDPIHPAYFWAAPDYEPPAPWFEDPSFSAHPAGFLGPGPAPHFAPRAEPVKYQNSAMTAELMAEIMYELLHAESEASTSQEVAVSNFDSLGHVNSEESQSVEAPSIEQAMSEAMAGPVDPVSTAEAGFGEQMPQGLEALLLEAMPQPEASPVQPDPFQQEQMLYDQQMQQLMNPFMMAGFGPGMMGSGFGPGPG